MAQVFNTEGNIYPKSEDQVLIKKIETALFQAFGPDTLRQDQSHTWDPKDPANNQCAVAALVINRLLPQFDQIVNDNRPEIDHYWCRNSQTLEEIDFTRCQAQLHNLLPEIRRVRQPAELLEGERAVKARTLQRFEVLLNRTIENLK